MPCNIISGSHYVVVKGAFLLGLVILEAQCDYNRIFLSSEIYKKATTLS